MTVRREGIFAAADTSYADFLGGAWDTICGALGITDWPASSAGRELASLLRPWGSQPIGTACAYPSKISRDGFPAELSVNWSQRGAEVRLLFEALADPPSEAANIDAGVELLHRLEAERGAYTGLFHKISDLYLRGPARCMWHSIACPATGPEIYKLYLDASAHGGPEDELLAETSARLGFAPAWRFVTGFLDDMTPRPQVEYIALDLTDNPAARVKVYFRNRLTTLQQLDRLAATASAHRGELARRAYAHMLPADAVITTEPLTCLAFHPYCERPTQATTYMRVPGGIPTERAATMRVAALMRECGLDPAGYLSMIEALAPGSLEELTGLQELVTCRVNDSAADVTVYLRFGVYQRQVNDFLS